jgi:hypothetical protein
MTRLNLIIGLLAFIMVVYVCCKNNNVQNVENNTVDSVEVVTNIDTLTTDTLITEK